MEKTDKFVLYKVLYALIIFLGAFLLFMFQPVTGKILTPQYGGGADIWAVCLLFFQFILFSGYLLAGFLNKLKPKTNAVIYSILFISAFVLFKLPTEFGSWLVGDDINPLLSLFISLFKYAALPVLVLSTISISMQNWYTRQTGESPYILYSISNIGSFLALFLYPLFYEPIIPTSSVVKLWHSGFAFLVLLIVAGAVGYSTLSKEVKNENKENASISLKKYLYWISLSAAGCILLTSYTTFVTVMIMPLPLLWTLFLGLYLLTFVLCFGSEKFYNKKIIFSMILFFSIVYLLYAWRSNAALVVLMLAGLFFSFLMVCNGEIYRTRPDSSRLSEFYLAIAGGGVIGGFFVNIIAPLIFGHYTELPMINVLMYSFVIFLIIKGNKKSEISKKMFVIRACIIGFTGIFILGAYGKALLNENKGKNIKSERNFYGAVSIETNDKEGIKSISNGSTVHGVQRYDLKSGVYEITPLSYFSDTSAFAYAFEGMKNHQTTKKRPLNAGVIGLGAGTVAAYTSKNDKMTFYEIDPKMYKAAKNDFTFLKDSKGKIDVLMGDARVVLSKSEPQNFDIMLVDAFSSDSIPVHLITKEAFEIYKKHIKNDGIILFHISNNYVSLDKMLEKLAVEENLRYVSYAAIRTPLSDTGAKEYKYTSYYFLIFMPENKLYAKFKDFKYTLVEGDTKVETGAIKIKSDEFLKPFTDDYSSLVRILKFWD